MTAQGLYYGMTILCRARWPGYTDDIDGEEAGEEERGLKRKLFQHIIAAIGGTG